jgi:hypothetical protein
MTLHLMFLFLHNMVGEDTGQGKKSDDVLKDTPRNNEQKPHRHCEKTLDEEASYLERTSKGFSWQSSNIDITSYCKDTPAIMNKSRVVIARKPWMKRLLI